MGTRAKRGTAPPNHEDEFVAVLEQVSREIRDPVAKLRFIRSSLSRYQSFDRAVRVVPWFPLRRTLHKWIGREGLRHQTELSGLGVPVRVNPRARTFRTLRRVGTVAGLLALVGFAVAGMLRARPAVAPPVLAAVPASPTLAEPLPPLPAAIAPSAVWLVEKGNDWELYSNGLRIDLTFATAGEPGASAFSKKPGACVPMCTRARSGSCSTRPRATSGRWMRRSTRTSGTAASACSGT